MDYVIYTFGGQGELVASIFNAIARMFASDSDYFTSVGKLSMSLGAVWAATYAIFQGNIGIFAKQWFFPSFLVFIFLFSPKATVKIHDSINYKQYAVANIPFAIALFSSLSSKISYFIADGIEAEFSIANRARSSHNGLMFGAKLVSKFRDIKIQDPILLDNAKTFTKQCYIRPWIMGNILGMRHEAETTKDVIAFLKANKAENFGIYYKKPKADTEDKEDKEDKEIKEVKETIEFRTCADITAPILNAIEKEAKSAKVLGKLGISLGGKDVSLKVLAKRLTETGNAALKTLARENQTVHQWVRQSMMLNIYRESLDDWREGAGYQRLWPEVISMNATRGLYQQSLGWMTSGEMAAQFLPLLQTILFLVVISSIFIVFPMSMLPGGYEIFKIWVKAMIWVNTWPIFFAIINCIGMHILAYKGSALGEDFGLDKTTQGEFSDMLIHTYAMVQMFASMVPILSWMLLSKSGHAFSTMVERLSPVATGAALGAATVDNTLNLDNINIGNRQLAQQNVGPSLNMGSSVDTGAMRVTQGDNKTFLDERASNLATNYRGSSMEMNALNDLYSDQKSNMDSLSVDKTKLAASESADLQNYAKKWSHSKSAGSTKNEQLTNAMRKVASENYNTSETFSSDQSKGTSTSVDGGIGFGPTSAKVAATNQKNVTHGTSAQKSESRQKALETVRTYAKAHDAKEMFSDGKELSESLTDTWKQQAQVSKKQSTARQTMQSLQNQISHVQQNQSSVDQNWNDKVLDKVAHQHDLGNKQEALSYLHSHAEEGEQTLKSLITEKHSNHENKIPPPPKILESTSSLNYDQEKQTLQATHTKRIQDNTEAQALKRQVSREANKTIANNVEKIPDNAENNTKEDFAHQKDKFNNTSDSTIKRAAVEFWDNIKPPGDKK